MCIWTKWTVSIENHHKAIKRINNNIANEWMSDENFEKYFIVIVIICSYFPFYIKTLKNLY